MRPRRDDELEEFVAARSQDLHHDAFVLTASPDAAAQLVAVTLAELTREHADLTQGASTARLRMARTATRTPAECQGRVPEDHVPARFRPLAALTWRQRAILLLELVDGYDLHSAARALHLRVRDVEQAYAAIPPDLTDTDPAQLRSLLQDFGDFTESPDPATTLADVRAVPPPPRRPWWTYAAAALVVALTIATLGITQTWHNDWLRTAAGLNHTHGTHFPAYTQGYKLVDIQTLAPGPAGSFALGPHGALAVECAAGAKTQEAVGRLFSPVIGDSPAMCSAPRTRQLLNPASGETVLAIDDFSRKHWPVAIYRQLSWDEYPVVTTGFVVEDDLSLASQRRMTDSDVVIPPLRRGRVLTLHGPADHPNGTFTATLETPAALPHSMPVFTGLLSPTTTGQFALVVGSEPPMTTCGAPATAIYTGSGNTGTCSLVDKYVPQVTYSGWGVFQALDDTTTVRFTVQHARGPWTLQLSYDLYRTSDDGQLVAP